MKVLDPHAAAAHHTRLNRLAYSLCGSAQLADDLTQETYLRVLARPRRLRGHGGEFPYLARTLRNVLNDHRRAQKRQPALVSDEQLAETPSMRGDGDPLRRRAPARCTRRSPRSPRAGATSIAAVDLAGLSYAETASALRIPLGTVMSRLHRARARLADALARHRKDPPHMIRPLLAAAAVLAVAAPSAAAHGGGAPDAEIFATNNTALITDSRRPPPRRPPVPLRRPRRGTSSATAAPSRAAPSCSTACSSTAA